MRTAVILLLFFTLPACQPEFRQANEELRPWTLAMADRQTPDASLVTYQIDKGLLVFAAVRHSNRLDSPTFELINNIFEVFQFDVLIVEGFETSASEDDIRNWAVSRKRLPGVQNGGESVPSIVGAVKQSASVVGGEPSDAQILRSSADSQVSEQDLLGFYTLRSIPQWIREGRITNAADPMLPELVDRELEKNRGRLGLSDHYLSSYLVWRDWYESINGKPFGTEFNPQEAGPSIDGQFGSNKISAAVSRVRAAHLHKLIIDQLNLERKTLVVFGSSHLAIHQPALDHVLGSPCYEGTDPNAGVAECNIEPTDKID